MGIETSSRTSYVWKFLRDPCYRDLVWKYGNEEHLFSAGFFDDGLTLPIEKQPSYDIRWLTTPLEKLMNGLPVSSESKPVVMLSTGGFSPIHRGHLAMMEKAKEALEKSGRLVLGGFLSPSHDSYVGSKPIGRHLSSQQRVHLCQKATRKSTWLDVDPWESCYVPSAINFTDVIRRLKSYVEFHLKIEVDIAYVFGSDNQGFVRAFLNGNIPVCVSRSSHSTEILKTDHKLEKVPTIWVELNDDSASRNIRNGSLDELPEEIIEDYQDMMNGRYNDIPSTEVYLIRNDIKESIEDFHIRDKRNKGEMFINGIISCMENNLNIETTVISVESQKETLTMDHHDILSLDNWIEGLGNLSISRLFSLSSSQFSGRGFIPRPGFDDFPSQVALIPSGRYTLVEDDSVTGSTIEFAKSLCQSREDILIDGIVLLSNLSSSQKYFDIVDARDFLLGGKDGGLVVRLPNGELSRVPYIAPYVNLHTRAKIPHSELMAFSQKILACNLSFYQESGILLQDINPHSRKLFSYVGFDNSTSMENIVRWHIEKLEVGYD